MAIVISDLHGNLEKIQKFVDFQPEKEHIVLGDFFDAWTASDITIQKTLEIAIEKNCSLVIGNHELLYLPDPPFYSSGFRKQSQSMFRDLLMANISKFQPLLIRDGYVLTHAGVGSGFFNSLKIKSKEKLETIVLEDWNDFLQNRTFSSIFNCSRARGGYHPFSGIFWHDYRCEPTLQGFKQVFGHTEGPKIIKRRNWVCTDTKLNECFDTESHQVLNF